MMHAEMEAVAGRGGLVVTSGRRLARALRREYDAAQRRKGLKAWPAPEILPLGAWLEAQCRAALYGGAGGTPLTLNELQEAWLWRGAIARSEAAGQLLQLDAAAEAARRSWTLLHAWRLPRKRGFWTGSEEAVAFQEWSLAYEAQCERLGATDAARVADVVGRLMRRGKLRAPREAWLAGFDEFTPQQEELLGSMETAGCDLVRTQFLEMPAEGASLSCHADASGELYAAAAWARETFERDPRATIGVVVVALERERARLERIFGELLLPRGGADRPFHVSLGPRLAEHPPVHAALKILENAPAGVSPYRGRTPDRAEPFPEKATASEWARRFAGRLDEHGWPGPAELASAEFQAVEAWREALNRFSTLELVAGPLAAAEALEQVRRMAERVRFQVQDPGCPIQVLGLPEAAGLEFDHLWVAGLHEEAWPAAASPDPFLPLPQQIERGVPHSSPRKELAYATRVTRRLLASAAEVVVSYAASEGEKRLGPSPLVAHLPARSRPAPRRPWYAGRADPELFTDETAPGVPAGQLAGGGTRTLALQSACPFRCFAEIRLRGVPGREPGLGPDARERGGALHDALERLWRELGSLAALLEASEPELAGLARRSAEAALPACENGFEKKLRQLDVERLEKLLLNWLEVEKRREAGFEATPELEREVEIGGLRLRTRADRVDRLSDGRLVLVDYKTTAPRPSAWEGERPDQPQLPLYAVTAGAPVAAVAFANLSPGGLRFFGRAGTAGVLPGIKADGGFADRLQQWRGVLERLAREYREGRAEVDPKDGDACRHCHLPMLCRVSEQR